jgi:cytochrome c oxidase subunit IV
LDRAFCAGDWINNKTSVLLEPVVKEAHMTHHPKQVLAGDENDGLDVTNPEHSTHHIVTPAQYCLVFATLLVGTAITVAAAYFDMGWANPVIALFIACFKACVVILFFMHAKYQSRLIKMTIASGFFVFLVLITMTLSDYISRSWGMW